MTVISEERRIWGTWQNRAKPNKVNQIIWRLKCEIKAKGRARGRQGKGEKAMWVNLGLTRVSAASFGDGAHSEPWAARKASKKVECTRTKFNNLGDKMATR